VHQPEALPVAVRPLEVVHEAPGEVAAHVDARAIGLVQGLDVPLEVADALGVVDAAVDQLVG
jgi:hypothetical protein